ncbi:MAG: DUF983 domain-containing protein [Bacteroidota bacterium]
MNKYCKVCNHQFEKETGFFIGAMYVSYSIAAAEMITCLVVLWNFMDMSPLYVFFTVAIIAILTCTLNFKISRSIWAHLFHKNKTS